MTPPPAPRELALSTLNRSPLFGVDPQTVAHVHAAADAGFTLLSPDVFSLRALDHPHERGGAPQDLDDLAGALADRGVGVLDIASLNLGITVEEDQANLAEMVRYVRLLKPRWVLVKLNAPAGPEHPAMLDTLRVAARALAEEGAALAFEPSALSALTTLGAGSALLDALDLASEGLPRGGVVADTWHVLATGERWDDLATVPVEDLAYLQLADGEPDPDGDLMEATLNQRSFPGDGHLDLARFAQVLGDRGFTGPASVEVLSAAHRGDSVSEFARVAHARMLPYV